MVLDTVLAAGISVTYKNDAIHTASRTYSQIVYTSSNRIKMKNPSRFQLLINYSCLSCHHQHHRHHYHCHIHNHWYHRVPQQESVTVVHLNDKRGCKSRFVRLFKTPQPTGHVTAPAERRFRNCVGDTSVMSWRQCSYEIGVTQARSHHP